MRVERINSHNSTISITARRNIKLLFQFLTPKVESDQFCGFLKERLQAHVDSMKQLKSFLKTCASEELLLGKEISFQGLGGKFGYIESKLAVEKSKLRYWVSYFREYGSNLFVIRLPTFFKLIRIGLPDTIRGEMWEVSSGSIFKRYANQGYYEKLHADHAGQTSLSTEEIEKDLNRFLYF
jgi:hypothetical protein